MPHDNYFYNYIIKLEDIFIDNFPSIATNNNIGSILKDLFCNVRFNHPCKSLNKHFFFTFIYKV